MAQTMAAVGSDHYSPRAAVTSEYLRSYLHALGHVSQ
jgi:hypothetical protein